MSFIKRVLNFGKLSGKKPIKEVPNDKIPENVKINLKGQRVMDETDGPNINIGSLDRQMYEKEKGPEMLETAVRKKVWFGMFMMAFYIQIN